jgi:hypothetical protein
VFQYALNHLGVIDDAYDTHFSTTARGVCDIMSTSFTFNVE